MNNLKRLRKISGLKQKEVSQKINVTQGLISQWETGISLPRTDLLPKIATLYKCSIDELLAKQHIS
jgi:transcriptional regulator with XRE-family HTH domain